MLKNDKYTGLRTKISNVKKLDLELLKTFLEVAQVRNFGKTAENLCVSPSTVSARIRQMEDALGLSLFTRGHHKITLTPAGERMVRHARFILGAWERAYEDTALGGGNYRRLVISGVASLWGVFLLDWVNKLYSDMPELGLRLEESTSKRVIEKLGRGVIDLGFLFEPPRLRDINVKEVLRIPLIMVSSNPEVSLDEAVSRGYIRVEWGTTFTSMHESHFPHRPIAPIRANTGRIALNLMLGSGGAAYLPRVVVDPYLRDSRLFAVEAAPEIEMKAYAAYLKQGEHRELIQGILARFE